jgi:hypothetical protein
MPRTKDPALLKFWQDIRSDTEKCYREVGARDRIIIASPDALISSSETGDA